MNRRIVLAFSCFGMALASTAGAAPPQAATPVSISPTSATSKGMPVFVQNIAPEAADAVKAVDAFSAAIRSVRLDLAAEMLDPKVLILESGDSERSRDEYMSSHAIADAAFMQTAQQQLRYRQAQATGDFAWVATQSELQVQKNGKPSLISSTETMLLRKTELGWKIVHIHWSSHAVKAQASGH